MVVVAGKVQQKCVGGGCDGKKKTNNRYVRVVDRGKINKRKNEGERRSWRWQLFNFCCHFLISKLGLCINLVQ